jgi:hypothetical protein
LPNRRSSLAERRARATLSPDPSLALIHPGAWKRNSANFAFTEF